MKIKTVRRTLLITIAIQAAIAISLLSTTITTNNSGRNNNNNQFLLSHQVLAQQQAKTTTTTPSATTTAEEETILRQGIISSQHWRPNETAELAVILPYREDGKIYTGTLAFTASRPVEVSLPHRVPLDKTTLSQIDFQKFGKLLIRNSTQLNGTIIHAPSRIMPDYHGSSTPYFSASIPFVASSVSLRSPAGDPFIAVYEVSATVGKQPEIVNNIKTALTNTTANK